LKIYLDVSCLNRPFDDQRQVRIRLESEAVTMILDRFQEGGWEHVSSEMALAEATRIPEPARRDRVIALLPAAMMKVTEEVWRRGRELQ